MQFRFFCKKLLVVILFTSIFWVTEMVTAAPPFKPKNNYEITWKSQQKSESATKESEQKKEITVTFVPDRGDYGMASWGIPTAFGSIIEFHVSLHQNELLNLILQQIIFDSDSDGDGEEPLSIDQTVYLSYLPLNILSGCPQRSANVRQNASVATVSSLFSLIEADNSVTVTGNLTEQGITWAVEFTLSQTQASISLTSNTGQIITGDFSSIASQICEYVNPPMTDNTAEAEFQQPAPAPVGSDEPPVPENPSLLTSGGVALIAAEGEPEKTTESDAEDVDKAGSPPSKKMRLSEKREDENTETEAIEASEHYSPSSESIAGPDKPLALSAEGETAPAENNHLPEMQLHEGQVLPLAIGTTIIYISASMPKK